MWSHLFRVFGKRPPERTLINRLKVGELQCIEGDALAIGTPLLSPFSGTECASFSILHSRCIEVTTSINRRRIERWSAAEELVFGKRFYVRDESGLVRVDRSGADVFAAKFAVRKIPGDVRSENLKKFREQELPEFDAQEALNELLPDGALVRHHEVVLAQGARVRVVGRVQSSGELLPQDAAVGFREAPMMLELVTDGRKKLRITRIKRTER